MLQQTISSITFEQSTAVFEPKAGTQRHRLAPAARVCVVGEFNAGKSTLINLLAGAPVVPTGITASTRLPIRLYYAPKPELGVELADGTLLALAPRKLDPTDWADAVMIHVGLPISRLQSCDLIDTPGLQSENANMCGRAIDACQNADVTIWCTSATQAWKATECNAWRRLPTRVRARSILVVTCKDRVVSHHDEGRLMGRMRAEAAPHFSHVVMVSARDGLAARSNSDANERAKLWHLSGAAELVSTIDIALGAVKIQRDRDANSRSAAAELVGAIS